MHEKRPVHIIAVDDEALSLEIIAHTLESAGYLVTCCTNGGQALLKLTNDPNEYDIIIIDRKMPVLDGLEVLKRIRQHDKIKNKPVIMQTALSMKEEKEEAIKEGAFFYLSKPYDSVALLQVVESAADFIARNEEKEDEEYTNSYSTDEDECYFEASTLEEVELIASYLAVLCPRPDKVLYGIQELMINGIEHGNLGIDNELKTHLDTMGTWYDEIKRRQSNPLNAAKKLKVWYKRDQYEIKITIKDDGEGFDWQKYMAMGSNSQKRKIGGVAISDITCFDEMKYIGKGNEVQCKITLSEKPVELEGIVNQKVASSGNSSNYNSSEDSW